MASDNLDRMMQSNQARKQNLKKWRAGRLHEETLPSGLEVLLRDVDIASLAVEGDIPNTLIELITSDEFQKASDADVASQILSGDHKTHLNSLLFQVAKAALVEPAIGDKADDQHILYSELTFDDKTYILNFMNREAKDLRPFREGTQKPDEASQPVGSLREQAE